MLSKQDLSKIKRVRKVSFLGGLARVFYIQREYFFIFFREFIKALVSVESGKLAHLTFIKHQKKA